MIFKIPVHNALRLFFNFLGTFAYKMVNSEKRTNPTILSIFESLKNLREVAEDQNRNEHET